MNIGLISDLADTGFGRVGRELAKRWLQAGHDVRILGINFGGREGYAAGAVQAGKSVDETLRKFDADPVLTRAIPADLNGDGMGFTLTAPFIAGQLTKGFRPDRLFLIADPQAAIQRLMMDSGATNTLPAWNYVPIEGSDLTPFWRRLWGHLQPIAMSEFGGREIGKCLGRTDIPVVPHGIGPAFHRISSKHPGRTTAGKAIRSVAAAKQALGWQGRTVILRTDRNVPRKDYPAFFAAIRPIIAAHPEVLVVIHCSPVDEGGAIAEWLADMPGAYDLGQGWQHSQIVLTRAHDTYRGVTDDQLNIMYNAADIYASPAWAEGFGLTLAEAARCGTPVVTTDFAAGPEAIGPGGICVPPDRLVPTLHGHRWSVVDIDAFSAALETLVTDPALRSSLGAAGEAHSARFDWDRCALDTLRLMEAA